MELVDMKRSNSESTLAKNPTGPSDSYPWGLSMNLSEEDIKKLGFEEDLPAAGATLMLMARVKVSSISQNQIEGGGVDRRMGLQITHMALGQDVKKQDNQEIAQKIYTSGPGKDEASM